MLNKSHLQSLQMMKKERQFEQRIRSCFNARFMTVLFFLSASVVKPEELLTINNGTVKIGIERTKGASIALLSWAAYPKNVVNSHDPGRLIQQSYYAGRRLDRSADGQHKAWSPWSWNPIQGGGVASWARVTEFKRSGEKTLFGETIPKLWDMPDEEAEALMRQWTGFEDGLANVVSVRCEFTAKRELNDRWGPTARNPQEIPACYFTRNFDIFKAYLGGGKWRTEEERPGNPWRHAEAPRHVIACFNADGQGVAVFSPNAKQWNFGPHAGGKNDDPLGDPCVHIAPVDLVYLGPQTTLEYRYWLVVGSETEIAASLDILWEKHSKERMKISNPDTTKK